MDKFEGIVWQVAKFSDRIAQASLAVLAVTVVVTVVGRSLNMAILGSREIVTISAVVLASFSIAYCAVQKGHVALTLVVDRLPQRAQAIINAITGIISVLLFVGLGGECIVWGTVEQHSGWHLVVTGLPIFPLVYVAGIGCLMLALVLIVDLCNLLSKRRGR